MITINDFINGNIDIAARVLIYDCRKNKSWKDKKAPDYEIKDFEKGVKLPEEILALRITYITVADDVIIIEGKENTNNWGWC